MKFVTACAIASAAAMGAEIEAEFHGQGYSGYGATNLGSIGIGKGLAYAAPAATQSYVQQPSLGYGAASLGKAVAAPAASYGKDWSRRSTIRPRDILAYNVEPVDPYYLSGEDKADETIVASCEFDFLGYSMSSGRLELK